MIFEYTWQRKELKKELIKRRYNTNIIFLILGIVLYVLFTLEAIKSNLFDKLVLLIGGVIFTLILALVLFITTKIYVFLSLKKNDKDTHNAYGKYKIELTASKMIVSLNDNQIIEYDYKDIVKVKRKKDSLFIATKQDKLGLIFKKHILGSQNYNQLLTFIDDKINC